ncbi:MAG: DUF262 domain-containing protein [Chloroflexota bacterium]|nr:DUF262 domain-containing protein [Chloroflexota bacterium]MDE2948378.1 DUF262 domain-containing protein [Chloroflexota bacterium]
MKLSTIIDQIDLGSLALPKFQRGYVWNRTQVRNLMRSLYKGYPVGSLLVWETQSGSAGIRGALASAPGSLRLLLDGQQRVTSLYGIVRGQPPSFFEGDKKAFEHLCFNLESEEFEFYGPTKMSGNPQWIKVTELMQNGAGNFIAKIIPTVAAEKVQLYIDRLNAIGNITNHDFHIDLVSGEDKTVDVVVDIFNQVNSGGTKLSKGDLALAKICAEWPQAREEMRLHLRKWEQSGYNFRLDWLLRCINAILTGQSEFSYLSDEPRERIAEALKRAEIHVDLALTHIAARLGLDHQRVLGSPNSLPAIIRYFDKLSSLSNQRTIDRLLYWYVHAMLWGRYSGTVESTMRQDLVTVDDNEDAIGALIESLRLSRGGLLIEAQHFSDWSRGSRFYPLLYMLTRVHGTRDLCSGIELKQLLLGKMSYLELHHIFPKSRLYKADYRRPEVNALANFTFLTAPCNQNISATLPEVYLPQCEDKHPGVLASHWIPEDPHLWKIENYLDFLAARRELLANASNAFLDQLLHGEMPETEAPAIAHVKADAPRPVSIASDEEEAALLRVMDWMKEKGLPSGELGYELPLAANGDAIVLDLAWPNGIQEGLSRKAALLIDETPETLAVVNHADYEYFTNVDELKRHVLDDILGEPA